MTFAFAILIKRNETVSLEFSFTMAKWRAISLMRISYPCYRQLYFCPLLGKTQFFCTYCSYSACFEVSIGKFPGGRWSDGNRFVTARDWSSHGVQALLTLWLIWLFQWIRRNHWEFCDVATATFIIVKSALGTKGGRHEPVSRPPEQGCVTSARQWAVLEQSGRGKWTSSGDWIPLPSPPGPSLLGLSVFAVQCCLTDTMNWEAANSRHLLSHSSRGLGAINRWTGVSKAEIKVSAGVGSDVSWKVLP